MEPFLQAVADELAEQVQSFDPEIATYARYALTNQGKQLRPALVALSAGAIGSVTPQQVRVAVIIEMVHLATLVHDDIMDEAEIRRRRPTLAANWGNQISVLLGDCLFANALELAASFPTPEICRAVSASTNTVCTGEILQTNRRLNFDFTRAEYFKVLAMKTAEFFSLACELGARLSGASDQERLALRDYGMALGIAYQVYDDCLDLFGSEDMVGKSLGTDRGSGKLTLPVLVVLENASKTDRNRLKDLIEHWEPHHHPRVLELMDNYGALTHSQAIINQYLRSGQQALSVIAPSDARAGLIGLTEFLAQQTDTLGFPY
ncbi:MAG: polyprenyl synthetase family protein [Pedosphaera parvula]|nr:polyprenyl synthetase family protein [Pedosphaera parvula]